VDERIVASILDAARSEVKRWGGDQPSLTHGALVLADRYQVDFTAVFGEDGTSAVRRLLESEQFVGSEPDLTALLRSADSAGVMSALHERLAPLLAASAEPETTAENQQVEQATTTGTGPPTESELTDRISKLVQRVEPADLPTREPEVLELAAQLVRERPPTTALVGEPGVGRTTCLGALAKVLSGVGDGMAVFRISPDSIVANPAASIRMVLDDLKTPAVVVIDDFDALARLGTETPDREFIALIEAARNSSEVRLLLVLGKRYRSRLSVISQSLSDEMVSLNLHEPPPDEVRRIARAEGELMAQRRGLTLDDAVVAAATAPAATSDSRLHPGLALARLDVACARAQLAGDQTVSLRHLGPEGDASSPIEREANDLADTLMEQVQGQEGAVRRVAQRLTLTRANLDLRPERPNGVFLFVGPTGVGKTQLAKEMAIAEYGGTDRLIRLDMSEYAEEWAISRLTGPMPGYVGSSEPESWLTTKVAAMPRCVVLLDEVEKAHPRVWNTFLQVFDAGRLTDSRGVTADFSDAVVVMTSNLGVQESQSKAVGFAGDGDQRSRDRLLAVIKERMPPELLNRLDEIIVFNALSMEAITSIARSEMDSVVARLAAGGWSVTFGPEVATWLAVTGYDAAYGARHLQRNIEREVLFKLTTAKSREVVVSIESGELKVIEAP